MGRVPRMAPGRPALALLAVASFAARTHLTRATHRPIAPACTALPHGTRIAAHRGAAAHRAARSRGSLAVHAVIAGERAIEVFWGLRAATALGAAAHALPEGRRPGAIESAAGRPALAHSRRRALATHALRPSAARRAIEVIAARAAAEARLIGIVLVPAAEAAAGTFVVGRRRHVIALSAGRAAIGFGLTLGLGLISARGGIVVLGAAGGPLGLIRGAAVVGRAVLFGLSRDCGEAGRAGGEGQKQRSWTHVVLR